MAKITASKSSPDESKLDVKEKFTYNSETDTYVTPIKSSVKPLVFSGAKHRAIIKAISGFVTPALTVEETSLKFGVPVKYLEEYKKIHAITRDTLPISEQEIASQSIEDSASQIMEEKRFAIAQAFEKLDWKETQRDADNWREFQAQKLDPFKLALESWTPPKLQTLKVADTIDESNKTLVIGLSDLHYGSASNARYMFNHKSWTTQDTIAAVDRYVTGIIESIQSRKYSFSKVLILGLGDLIHSVCGKTARGTELKYDCIREEQFDYALTSLTTLISRIAEVVSDIDVHDVGGNHNYEADVALFRALEMHFKPVKNISFFHHSSRPASFVEGTTLFLLDHGADSIERTYVPTTENKLQLHVQSLLLSNPKILEGTRTRLFCMGDKHHWEHLEYNDFEFIMFGTILGSDEHAAVNNLRNRGRQSCLVLDDEGLKEVLHFYSK